MTDFAERIDATDLEIVSLLQEDARVSNAELARRIGMTPSGALARMRRLEERGIVQGYVPQLDPQVLGLGLLAFVFLSTSETLADPAVAEQLASFPEVLEIHDIAGDACYLLKVRCKDHAGLHALLRERIGSLAGIRSTNTVIVLKTFKETAALPLPSAPEPGDPQ